MTVASIARKQQVLLQAAQDAVEMVERLQSEEAIPPQLGRALAQRLKIAMWIANGNQQRLPFPAWAFDTPNGEESLEALTRVVGSLRHELAVRTDHGGESVIDELDVALLLALKVAESRTEAFEEVIAGGAEEDEPNLAFYEETGSTVLDLQSRLDDLRDIEAIRRTSAQVESTASEVRQLATSEAAGSLAEHFEGVASDELASAKSWRIGSLASVAVLAALAVSYWAVPALEAETWLDFARKASVAVPLGALAAYAAREAHDHRRVARWAKALAVQLQTVSPFTRSLGDDARQDVLRAFGLSLFTAMSPGEFSRKAQENADPLSSDLVRQAVEVLRLGRLP